MRLRELSGCEPSRRSVRSHMKKNRKTSPELQKQVNPGPDTDAKITDIGNPSGLPNMSIPRGRGGTSNDHSATEKQNQ
jgi:hypothetical protein